MTVPTHQGRDPHADPLVASVVHAAGAVAAVDCPELDVLALYAERELSTDERGPVDVHVASCGRCQATVAAFVRSAPDASAPDVVGRAVGVPWWAAWRWVVPVASATAVVAVAVWVGREPADRAARSTAPVAETGAIAPPVLTDAQAPDANALVLEGNAAKSIGPGRVQQAAPEAAATATARARENEARDTLAKAEGQFESARQRVSGDARQDAATPSAAAPLTPTRPAPVAMTAPAATEPAVAEPAVAAEPAQTTTAATGTAAGAGARGRDAAEADTPPLARTENAAGRRSALASATAAQRLGWRVRAGVVERSVDQGQTWTRTASPTANRLADVSATDGRTATVATESGVRFATSDGGATWRRVP